MKSNHIYYRMIKWNKDYLNKKLLCICQLLKRISKMFMMALYKNIKTYIMYSEKESINM